MNASSARPNNCLVSSALLGPEWVGLSVTMPGKFAALEFADQRTERAELVGSANTLLGTPTGGWRADNTDIDGVVGALGTAGDVGTGDRVGRHRPGCRGGPGRARYAADHHRGAR